ncbi:MAG: KamA family radical SAM protein [Desulfuromonadales bacterium]|nr:KamA family radical SAM protein [Desulfuromonadales bacterium]
MDAWQQSIAQSLSDPATLAARFGLDPAAVSKVAARYPLRLTPHLLTLIERPDDPLGRQFLPDPRELANDGLPDDPLAENRLAPLPAIVHRYPSRVLLLAGNNCAAYCRFCTRKRRVGCAVFNLPFSELLKGVDYIAGHAEINEVIISGGDPLLLSDDALAEVLERLRRIPHLGVLRIATRTLTVLPERITPALATLLGRHAPLYLTTHFNHPRELTAAAGEACRRLAEAGIPLANQTVLLRGVNDDIDTLVTLCDRLLRLRVRPYYLHQLDPVRGTGHFRVSIERGLQLVGALRERVSGLAVPHYILDLPGGRGKVALTPERIVSLGPAMVIRLADGGTAEVPNDEGESQAVPRGLST